MGNEVGFRQCGIRARKPDVDLPEHVHGLLDGLVPDDGDFDEAVDRPFVVAMIVPGIRVVGRTLQLPVFAVRPLHIAEQCLVDPAMLSAALRQFVAAQQHA
ncbi:MAG: hypothetical protein M3Y22_08595, partial [Pseudomonadota bacterium]|nr:hypothetical protein [Pseudomonadota bacterium]